MDYGDVVRAVRTLPAPLPLASRRLVPMLLQGPAGGGHGPTAGDHPPGRAGTTRQAAALVLLYPDDAGEARVLLTERARGDLRHSGEVSFPGGAVDPGDVSLEAAALREAREEVGLDAAAARVEVIGRLGVVEIRVSGFRLHPVLAVAERAPGGLVADAREVAAILEVPIRHFLPTAPIVMIEADRDGRQLRYGAFPWRKYRIWGATGRVLGQLGAILAGGT